MSDTPDRKRHEDELRRLNRLYSVLSEVNHAMVQVRSGDKLLQRICQSTVAYGGLTLAWIGWLDVKTGYILRKAFAGEPREFLDSLKIRVDDENSLAAIAIREGKAAVWNGAKSNAGEPLHPLAEKAGLRSAAAVPICSKGQLVGALTVYAHEANFFGDREIDLLGKMAVDVSFGLDHLEHEAKREAALNYERDLLRALMDNSPDHIYFKDIESRFIRCSKAMCDRFGTTTKEIVGKQDSDFFSEEHAKEAFEDEQTMIRTGTPLVGKVEKETWKGGQETWVLTAKMPFRNERNEIIGTLGISKDITAIKKAENDLEQINKQLLEASRLAGMAEVATSVLHNVGNVLNSVNVSSALIGDKVRTSKVVNLAKVAALLKEQSADLPGFFANSPKGKQLPGYLADLASHLSAEREEILRELQLLAHNLEHVKEIVSMQQNYARFSNARESLNLPDLIEDALRLHSGAIERHHLQIVREYAPVPPVVVDKHKVLQILVNLIQNAKRAIQDCASAEKQITVRLDMNGADHVRISVIDKGVGIPAENLSLIFQHGFTTRKDGHGFGLHSGVLAARDLGGTLTAHSEGPGKGATFVLEIPCQPKTEP